MTRLSGAVLRVLKYANEEEDVMRLFAQYDWLHARNDRPGLVNVYHLTEMGYEMELLDAYERPMSWLYVSAIVSTLEQNVWEPTGRALQWKQHLEYVEERGGPDWLLDWGVRLERDASNLPLVETHGDPTPDNLLARNVVGHKVQPVLIDPLPDLLDGRIPPLIQADLGKLLGWSIPNPTWEKDVLKWTSMIELTRYFAAVAVVRRARRSGEDLSWLLTWTGFSSKAKQL